MVLVLRHVLGMKVPENAWGAAGPLSALCGAMELPTLSRPIAQIAGYFKRKLNHQNKTAEQALQQTLIIIHKQLIKHHMLTIANEVETPTSLQHNHY